MRPTNLKAVLFAACLGVGSIAHGQVVINEFAYDDGGTDDREFVELFNAGTTAVDIGNWKIGGRDTGATANPSATIAGGTMLAPGAYYVIANTGVLNVNQVVAINFLENDQESIELLDATGALVDAVAYEANKGIAFTSGFASQVGPGIWGNNQASDIAGTPLVPSNSLGRFVDGRDTGNNGRDFGMRVATPGAANNPVNITQYVVPDLSAAAVGSAVPNYAYSYVPPRVIDPTVVDGNNLNAIPALPGGGKAIIAWDPSGGGNGVAAGETFNTGQARFDIKAYFDTRDLPLMYNASNVTFRGTEMTVYGIGNGDGLGNFTDLSGLMTAADSANGTTGIAWIYEKVGETGTGLGDVSEKLYLVDANDGGDAGTGGVTPLDWTILATVDLSAVSSDWYDLGISIDANGNGTAYFNDQFFNFATTGFHSGAFNVAYRENTQFGADGTPDAVLRPPTFAAVPEPGTALAGAALAALSTLRRRRK